MAISVNWIRNSIRVFLLSGFFSQTACVDVHAQNDTPTWFRAGVTAALIDGKYVLTCQALKLPDTLQVFVRENAFTSEQQRAIVDATLGCIHADLSSGRDSAALNVLSRIKINDPAQRVAVAHLLVKLFNEHRSKYNVGKLDTLVAMAQILGRIGADEPSVRDEILKSLVDCFKDCVPMLTGAAAAGLGQIALRDPAQRPLIANILFERAKNGFDESGSDAHALVSVTVDDAQRRQDTISALLSSVSNQSLPPHTTLRVAQALHRMNPNEPEQRAILIDALINILNDWGRRSFTISVARLLDQVADDWNMRGVIITELLKRIDKRAGDVNATLRAFGQIKLGDSQRTAIIARLLRSLRDTELRDGAADALGGIAVNYPMHRDAIVSAFLQQLNNVNDIPTQILEALPQIKLDPKQRKAAISSALRVLAETNNGYIASEVGTMLAQLEPDDPNQHEAIASALIRLLDTPYNYKHAGSADAPFQLATEALGKIRKDHPSRNAIVVALLKRVSDSDTGDYALDALTEINPDDQTQRNLTLHAGLMQLITGSLSETPLRALLAFGPIATDDILALFGAMHDGPVAQTNYWRALAIAHAGQTPPSSASWFFLRFMGRANPNTIPWFEISGSAGVATTYLRHIQSHWAALASSKGLAREAGDLIVEIADRACPFTAQNPTDRPWYASAAEQVLHEFSATWRWTWSKMFPGNKWSCWSDLDRELLTGLQGRVQQAGFTGNAKAIERHLTSDGATPAVGLFVTSYLAWAVPCLALIVAFPYSNRVRALYLYDDKARALLSLGWVPILLTIFPFLRSRMLRPFRNDLLADARLADFDETQWFAGCVVADRLGKVLPLAQAIPDIHGNVLLIGESGLGKSMYLRFLAKRSKQILVYLNARSCNEGILKAILSRTKEVQSSHFFKSLIYTRDLAIIIDGLNEVSADIRAGIVSFANDFPEANLLIATQPIESIGSDRSPFSRATAYELRPLDRSEVESFLVTRPSRNAPGAVVSGAAFDETARRFITNQLDNAPTPEEKEAARIILSNPMDLTYAAELLAIGETPRPTDMIGQAFRLACSHYESYAKRSFPKLAFARKVVELRVEDRNWIYADEFANEQAALREYRLMVPRAARGKDGSEAVNLLFRHDKVMDFFMFIAFTGDEQLQLQYMDDPKFRGVYLLFAQTAELEVARRLRDFVVTRAAETLDHTLSDEFVRRLSVRDPMTGRGRKGSASHFCLTDTGGAI